MKQTMFMLLPLTLFMALPLGADQLQITLKGAVDYYIGKKLAATAFREEGTCTNWNYLPRYLISSSSYRNGTGLVNLYDNGPYLGYVSALDFQVSPVLTPNDLDAFKAKIRNEAGAAGECKGQLNPSSPIALNSIPVKALPMEVQNTQQLSTNGGFTSTLHPLTGTSSSNTFRDAVNPIQVSVRLDASSATTPDDLRELVEGSQVEPQNVGELQYVVSGVDIRVNSRLTIKGDIRAIFESHLKDKGCERHNDHKDTTHDYGLPLAESFGFNDRGSKCSAELMTDYKGGKFGSELTFDDKDSDFVVNGQAVRFITYDDDRQPVSTSLADYVHTEMFHMLLMSRYDAALGKIIDSTFVKSQGANGEAKTTVDVNVSYLMKFNGQFTLGARVYVSRLDKAQLRLDWAKTPFTTCESLSYLQRRVASPTKLFAPIGNECVQPQSRKVN